MRKITIEELWEKVKYCLFTISIENGNKEIKQTKIQDLFKVRAFTEKCIAKMKITLIIDNI